MPADFQKLMFKKLLCDTDIVGRVIKPGGKVMLLGKSDSGLIKTPVLHEDQRPAASGSLTPDAEDARNVLGRHGELTEMAALNAERVARQDMRASLATIPRPQGISSGAVCVSFSPSAFTFDTEPHNQLCNLASFDATLTPRTLIHTRMKCIISVSSVSVRNFVRNRGC